MYKGSFLCGAITYELTSEPTAVSHCHCNMCQKQHGAAFATYVSIPRSDFHYLSGEQSLITYNSSGSILRKFCGICGSNIEWSGDEEHPDRVAITLATFDTPFTTKKIKNIYLESRACWLETIS